MEPTIKAIETQYKGYRFRSRLEARWAVFFDNLGLEWEYEKEGYELDGTRYLPDFYIPCLGGEFRGNNGGFVEIKPKIEYRPYTKIYLAGKIGGTDWRHELEHELSNKAERFFITGPGYLDHNAFGNTDIVKICFDDIDYSDYIFANINTLDSPGTLIELGYAIAQNKKILVRYDNSELEEHFWFLSGGLPYFDNESVGGNMSDMLSKILPPLSQTFDKCRKLSKYKRVILMQGDPLEASISVFGPGNESDWGTNLVHACAIFLNIKNDGVEKAARIARSARFEFGEKG